MIYLNNHKSGSLSAAFIFSMFSVGILQEIIESKIYQGGHEDVTARMLYEDVPYDRAIQALNVIIQSRFFEAE